MVPQPSEYPKTTEALGEKSGRGSAVRCFDRARSCIDLGEVELEFLGPVSRLTTARG